MFDEPAAKIPDLLKRVQSYLESNPKVNGKRQATRKLINAFLNPESNDALSVDDLIEQVYGVNAATVSVRYQKSLRHSLIKLISRARSHMARGIKDDLGGRWFCYSRDQKTYAFYGKPSAQKLIWNGRRGILIGERKLPK
jgi:hypothetical protein